MEDTQDEIAASSPTAEDVFEHTPPSPEATAPEAAEPGLKYLEFLRVAIIQGSAYAVKLYNYGKENSGSLKASVDSVEGAVKIVAGPVAQKIEGKLPELLQYADKKVDDTVHYLDILLPQAVNLAVETARQAPGAAMTVVGSLQGQGVCSTATNYCGKFRPIAESYGSQAWQTLLSLPLAPQAVGTARIGAEKLNQILFNLKESHVPALPLTYFQMPAEVQQVEEQFQVR